MKKQSEQINAFITEYRDFLAANKIDVAHSTIKDEWFVYQIQEGYDDYEYFIQFSTVNDLVDIILDEMAFVLYSAIKEEIAPPEYDDDNIINFLANSYSTKNTTQNLTTLLEMVLSSEYGKESRFFQTLDKLFARRAYNQSSKTE